MPGYIERVLKRFNQPHRDHPQHSPHTWTASQYGSTMRMTEDDDDSDKLSPTLVKASPRDNWGINFSCWVWSIATSMVTIATLASAQATVTKVAMKAAAVQLLNYEVTQKEYKILEKYVVVRIFIIPDNPE